MVGYEDNITYRCYVIMHDIAIVWVTGDNLGLIGMSGILAL